MKRSGKRLLAALAVYALLIVLFVQGEIGLRAAKLKDFADAVWYSMITMTTIGYGDVAPVSLLGRLVGLIFALSSIGILTALISMGLNLIGGEWLPRLRLRFGRNQRWYVFSAENEDAAALASALNRKDGDCMLVFPAGGKQTDAKNAVRLRWDAEELVRLRGTTEGITLFFMGDQPWENYTRSIEASGLGLDCCCMADVAAEQLHHRMQLFSPNEAMSRSYWKEHPLKRSERCVVLIGCGAAGSALLERALMTNVFEAGRSVEYHVFGDTSRFAALHPVILKVMADAEPGEDSLQMHAESWMQAHGLLCSADRVILCADSDAENFAVCETLKRWFGTTATLHVRLSERVPGLVTFGERSESMSPEYVMKDELNRQARLMNDIYNEGEANPTAWEELSPFHRQSNIATADHLIVKARCLLGDETLTELDAETCGKAYARFLELLETQKDALQEMEHRRWMRFYQMYNWEYAPVRDNARRRHPMLLPYEQLSEAERHKDAYAWEVLGRLAER